MAPPAAKKGKQKAAIMDADVPAINGILHEIPDPIATLNVGDVDNLAHSYEKCVKDIIASMKEATDRGITFNKANGELLCYVPLTPGPDQSPSGAYTISLTDGTREVRLVAEKYQAWFRGFVTSEGHRFELDELTPKMMQGSESLYNSGRYYDLIHKTVAECIVGFHPIREAFYSLVDHPDPEKGRNYKLGIAVILVMLFEAPRFPAVFEMCLELIREMRDALVGEAFQKLINNWSVKSYRFYAEIKEETTVVLTEGASALTKEVAKGITILCRSKWDEWLSDRAKQEEASRARRGSRQGRTEATGEGSSRRSR